MKISVVCPVKNEVQFIGYSIMAALPVVHEFIYTVADSSDDGTIDLLESLKPDLGARLKVIVDKKYDFNPMDMAAYNRAFNDGIERMTGDAAWFLHPDMIVTGFDPAARKEGALACFTRVTSYAKDLGTVITKGRTGLWKNIHAKKFGLHYYGGYGSQNEDFYHSAITGKAYAHHGNDFFKYPFEVADSGISVNHYCEVKPYPRRYEKMKLCLRTQNPKASEEWIEEVASQHPRVTLEPTTAQFGHFEFEKSKEPVPEVFAKYRDRFELFKREPVHA